MAGLPARSVKGRRWWKKPFLDGVEMFLSLADLLSLLMGPLLVLVCARVVISGVDRAADVIWLLTDFTPSLKKPDGSVNTAGREEAAGEDLPARPVHVFVWLVKREEDGPSSAPIHRLAKPLTESWASQTGLRRYK